MRRTMTRACGAAAVLAMAGAARAEALRVRAPVDIPDIPGYLTLKCDFHMHTVFSDGAVWPPVRAEEAWREGLDAIAITDHIEYQPHKKDLPTAHNRSYELAKPLGDELGVIVIRGSEITRQMPPGHLNAIFLTDARPLDTNDWRVALRMARDQGAFIMWNHPGWTGQQPDGVERWYPEHSELLEQGLMHGIEVVNHPDYYPEAHRWAMESNLTMMASTDVHTPMGLMLDFAAGDRRPMTLVFARERTAESIKEALMGRRTAVYHENLLIGAERFLRPVFDASVKIAKPAFRIKEKQRVAVQVHNRSCVTFDLARAAEVPGLTLPKSVKLVAGRISLIEVRGAGNTDAGRRQISLPYAVTNALVGPGTPLKVELPLEVTFE